MFKKNLWAALPSFALATLAAASYLKSTDDTLEPFGAVQSYDSLAAKKAFIVGDDGTYLGEISKNRYDKDSIANTYGKGSRYQTDGLFNPYSRFGDKYSPTSAFNSYATKPPKIMVRQYGKTDMIGRLTLNRNMPTGGDIYDPEKLKGWASP